MTLLLLRAVFALSQPVAGATAVADLCAPCTVGAHCMSSKCLLDANNNGICSQGCGASSDCPTSFSCSASLGMCTPITASTCPSPYPTPVNQLCQIPPVAAGNPNTAVTRSCAAGLVCYAFLPNSDGYSLGVCVEHCSTLSNSAVCPFGDTCCFTSTTDGSCVNAVSSEYTDGGCFLLGDVGDSCADGNKSYCLPGATCMFTSTASDARCYDTCDQGLCNEGGTCQTINNVGICCDKSRFNPKDLTTCLPAPGYCRRQVGVRCDTNEQCKLGYCLKAGTTAACSQPCATSDDCPGTNDDVNGDGVADGGSSCQNFGGSKYCWPRNGPIAAPACARIAEQQSPLLHGKGCNCRSSEGTAALLASTAAILVRRWRRRRAPMGR